MEHSTRMNESLRLIKLHKTLLLDAVASVQADYHLFIQEEDTYRAVMKLQTFDRSVERLQEEIEKLKSEYECFHYHRSESKGEEGYGL